MWDQFVNLFNTNSYVQLTCILGFWSLMIGLVIAISRRSLKRSQVPSQISVREVSYITNKQEKYGQFRKTIRDFSVSLYSHFEESLISRVNSLNVPSQVVFLWEETQGWQGFFKHLGSLLVTRFFEDIENNGFELITRDLTESEIDGATAKFIEEKKSLIHSLIKRTLASEFSKQSYRRVNEKEYVLREEQVLSYDDLEKIIEENLLFVDKMIDELYRNLISAARRDNQ